MKYTKGITYEEFINDDKTMDAVIRNVEILGEAVKNITKDFTEKYPQVEWSEIARTRDKFIHFYFGLDRDVLWKIVTSDVPSLVEKLKDIITAEGWQDELEE